MERSFSPTFKPQCTGQTQKYRKKNQLEGHNYPAIMDSCRFVLMRSKPLNKGMKAKENEWSKKCLEDALKNFADRTRRT